MKTQTELPGLAPSGAGPTRAVMNGKPVFTVRSDTAINFKSHFGIKLLCDGLTFTTGSACVYKCAFCYVPDLMRKLYFTPAMAQVKGKKHEDVVIRRENAIDTLRRQLTDRHGRPKFWDPADRRVIYASPLVDVAGNMELVRETIEACKLILELTNWDIRLLSKSNLLPKVAEGIPETCGLFANQPRTPKERIIYGVSTGTLRDNLAKVFEEGTPLVSKRIQSLHWLQDNGFRTYGMLCPSLPLVQGRGNYDTFARDMASAIRAQRCEHVWAEVINLRGESMVRTVDALRGGGFYEEASLLQMVSTNKDAWERYARATFEAHAAIYPKGKLRFLQYIKPTTKDWWTSQVERGAVLL